MHRRAFLSSLVATAGGLLLPHEPRRVYSFASELRVPGEGEDEGYSFRLTSYGQLEADTPGQLGTFTKDGEWKPRAWRDEEEARLAERIQELHAAPWAVVKVDHPAGVVTVVDSLGAGLEPMSADRARHLAERIAKNNPAVAMYPDDYIFRNG